jgi:hypothetical protein
VSFDLDDEWDFLFVQKAEPLCSYELAIREERFNSADLKAFHDLL